MITDVCSIFGCIRENIFCPKPQTCELYKTVNKIHHFGMNLPETMGLEYIEIQLGDYVLRTPHIEDAEKLFKISQDSQIRHYVAPGTFPLSVEDFRQQLLEHVEMQSKPTHVLKWVIEYNSTCIGSVELRFEFFANPFRGEIGLYLDPQYWNRGIATLVVKEIMNFAFSYDDVLSLQMSTPSHNVACQRMITKCGFNLDGTVRGAFLHDTGIYDEIVYTLLRENYELGF
jgi:[ribosomal protein S5]-alanine N-acetyltransferase